MKHRNRFKSTTDAMMQELARNRAAELDDALDGAVDAIAETYRAYTIWPVTETSELALHRAANRLPPTATLGDLAAALARRSSRVAQEVA